MELEDVHYKGADYIETASGNKVCRKSVLCGSQNIMLNGKVISSFFFAHFKFNSNFEHFRQLFNQTVLLEETWLMLKLDAIV